MPPRVVLDTNVCLDLLLFDDPRCARLRVALHTGEVVAVCNRACRDEWQRVLRYPKLRLDEAACVELQQAFDGLIECLPDGTTSLQAAVLPLCADPDDQKFLQLTLDSGARWLLSRDADVLALGRRTARAGLFDIVSPQQWSLHTLAIS